jgi:ankyrin repeat protein
MRLLPRLAMCWDDVWSADRMNLHEAVKTGDLDRVQTLAESGADVNATDKVRRVTDKYMRHWPGLG